MDALEAYLHLDGFAPSLLLAAVFLAALFYARRTIWGLAVLALPGSTVAPCVGLCFGVALGTEIDVRLAALARIEADSAVTLALYDGRSIVSAKRLLQVSVERLDVERKPLHRHTNR